MSNFGFTDLRVVNPYEASFREARSAVGASSVLAAAREYESLAEAVADCGLVIGTTAAARRKLQQPLRRLDEGASMIGKKLRSERVALLFGSEKRGLSNEDFSHCHWLLRIPTREEHGSMNLGQAIAVCLYEIARNARSPGKTGKASGLGLKRATASELERITTVLLETLRASGYLAAGPSFSADEKVRRMVRRLDLSSSDAKVWLGMLRQILWKMKEVE